MHFYFYPRYVPHLEKIKAATRYHSEAKSSDVDYLILGDSTAFFGIDPTTLPGYSVSFSLPASSLYFSEKQLHEISPMKIRRGLLLTQSFVSDHYDLDLWSLLVPSRMLDLKDIFNILCATHSCSLIKRIEIYSEYYLAKLYIGTYAIEYLVDRIRHLDRDYSNLQLDYYNNLKENRGFLSKIGNVLPPTVFNYANAESLLRPIHPIPDSEKIALLKMIGFANLHKIKIYFVIMPKADAYSSVSKTISEDTKYIKKFLAPFENEDFKVIDASLMSNAMKIEDFWDFSHLNILGAKKIGNFIRTQLN
jgi:hypothetical protein